MLTCFDAFIIGLTAAPDKRTFAFFDENVVSEYPRDRLSRTKRRQQMDELADDIIENLQSALESFQKLQTQLM